MEGDIAITDLVIDRNQNAEYLIPSLLALKHKVERLFGVQPSVSLSESRSTKAEDLCENEAMRFQFRCYAESVMMSKNNSNRNENENENDNVNENENVNEKKKKKNLKKNERDSMNEMEMEMEMEVELGSEIEDVNESLLCCDPLLSGGEMNGKDRETLDFSNGKECKLGKSGSEMENQSENDQNRNEFESENHPNESNEKKNEIHPCEKNTTNTKQSYDYKQIILPKREKWKPLFADGEILYRRFLYSIKPPSRDSVVLKDLMKSYHLPCCHYDDLVTMKEFNTTEVLNELEHEIELKGEQTKQQSENRIEFWKEILGSAPIPRFRRFVYSIKPPIIPKQASSPPPIEPIELQSSLNSSALLNSSITQFSQNETPPVMHRTNL